MKYVRTLLLMLMLCGCVDNPPKPPALDVVRNHALNTTDVRADGDSWKLFLPPNFIVLKHDFSLASEDLIAKSKFTIGSRSIFVSITSYKWLSDAQIPYDSANGSLDKLPGFSKIYGPEEKKFSEKVGSLYVGSDEMSELIYFQFTTVTNNQAYVLRCSGDNGAQARVGYRCKDILDRLKLTGAPKKAPVVAPTPSK